MEDYHGHDLSDEAWERQEKKLGTQRDVGGSPKTTDDLSMACSGYYEPAHLGEICRRTMAAGKTLSGVFAVGGIMAHWESLRLKERCLLRAGAGQSGIFASA